VREDGETGVRIGVSDSGRRDLLEIGTCPDIGSYASGIAPGVEIVVSVKSSSMGEEVAGCDLRCGMAITQSEVGQHVLHARIETDQSPIDGVKVECGRKHFCGRSHLKQGFRGDAVAEIRP
jgi:hypothetical protein